VFLAGIAIEDKLVLTLAANLPDAGLDETAERLETAYDRETAVLALSVAHRDDLLQVLVECPEGLCELRAVLLQQQEWRARYARAGRPLLLLHKARGLQEVAGVVTGGGTKPIKAMQEHLGISRRGHGAGVRPPPSSSAATPSRPWRRR
jgi:hypothetical protein